MIDSHGHESTPEPSDFIVSVPLGDHPLTADHLANTAIALIAGTLSEIVDVVAVHEDMAPTSASYVLHLAGTIADTAIEWMGRWPS
ncbi:hypothetical protein [Nocardia brasiliensis]|uniref:hypothetical protein n=1 Tax=Nocardia brasiliensis TaxID=37326 RepID=UPI003D939D6E